MITELYDHLQSQAGKDIIRDFLKAAGITKNLEDAHKKLNNHFKLIASRKIKTWFKCGLKASKGVFKEGKKETLTRLKREHKRGGERKLQKA